MSSNRRRSLIVLAVAAIAGAGAGIAIGLNEDPESDRSAGSAALPASSEPAPEPVPDDPGRDNELPPLEDDPEGAAPGPSGPPPESTEERTIATAARGYIQALDRRSGAAVCRAFAPGALDGFDFPVERSSCPATVESSLGFAKRGLPVWEHSEMTDAVSALPNGDSARVVATVFTVYADVREPTIEDDIIYLRQSGERWLVAKPSLTLFRAIGDANPPPSVLTPP